MRKTLPKRDTKQPPNFNHFFNFRSNGLERCSILQNQNKNGESSRIIELKYNTRSLIYPSYLSPIFPKKKKISRNPRVEILQLVYPKTPLPLYHSLERHRVYTYRIRFSSGVSVTRSFHASNPSPGVAGR